MKKLLLAAAVLAALYYLNQSQRHEPESGGFAEWGETVSPADGSDAIAEAFGDQASGIQVSSSGTVARILADDEAGGRHQRFILRLESGQTLLVAHNIDLAPRIDALEVGDTVTFNGEYEWNDKGGVLHWTHHDPQGQHEAGWLRHRGHTYR